MMSLTLMKTNQTVRWVQIMVTFFQLLTQIWHPGFDSQSLSNCIQSFLWISTVNTNPLCPWTNSFWRCHVVVVTQHATCCHRWTKLWRHVIDPVLTCMTSFFSVLAKSYVMVHLVDVFRRFYDVCDVIWLCLVVWELGNTIQYGGLDN